MFKIGDFSKICRIPVSALRYYAGIGLLEPAQIDPMTNYRYYSAEQLPRLNRILALRDLGFSLDQIKDMLNEGLNAEQLRGMLRLKRAEVEQTLETEQARLQRIEARLRQIELEGKMSDQEVVLKGIAPQKVLSIRETIPTGEVVEQLLGMSFGAIMAQGVEIAGPPMTIFHDPEFKPTDLDVEIVIPVAASTHSGLNLEGGRRLILSDLPGIPQAACVIHTGRYDTLQQTYEVIGQWIEANGYRIAGPVREIYLTAPDEQGNAVTEIQWPVERA